MLQEELPALFAPENEYRIFGPPGTGKTTKLTQIIAELAKEHGPTTIMVASFTRTAAEELVSRIDGIPHDQVKTLHAFGLAALGGNRKIADQSIPLWNTWISRNVTSLGIRANLTLSTEATRTENDDLLAERASATTRNTAQGEGDKDFSQMAVLRARMVPETLWPGRLQRFMRYWRSFKADYNLIDFMDMIELPLQQQLPPPGHPKFLILDEAQDFTAAEWALARWWGQGMERVYAAMDDDQSLYYFKGADPESCLEPDVVPERKIILAQSYRVPAAVHTYAQDWIETASKREPKNYYPRTDDAGTVVTGEVRYISPIHASGTRAGSYLAPEVVVRDALDHYLSRHKSVMFLTTCSYMLNPLKAVLRKQGIPFHNIYRRSRNDWNPLTPASGVASSQRLLDFLRPQPEIYGAQARLWNIEEFLSWTEALAVSGVLKHGMRREIEHFHAACGDDRDVLTRELNLDDDQLFRWLEEEAVAAALDGDLDWFEKHLAGAKREGMQFPLAIARQSEAGARALMGKIHVTIGTIHSVKGGQADAVYLFPDISREADKDPTGVYKKEELMALPAEVRGKILRDGRRLHRDTLIRTFYVGMTRARESLIICPPAANGPHIDLPNPGLW